jgi:hypothetical protein
MHEDYVIARSELGLLLTRSGELTAAREVLEQALAGTSRVCGDPSRALLEAELAWAEFQLAAGDLSEARRHCGQAVVAIEKLFGAAHPTRMRAHLLLARMLSRGGDAPSAERELVAAQRIASESRLGDHPLQAELVEALGRLPQRTGA